MTKLFGFFILLGAILNCSSQENSVDFQFSINQTEFGEPEFLTLNQKGSINFEGILGYNRKIKFGYARIGVGLTTFNYVNKYLPTNAFDPIDPLFSELKQKGHVYLIVPIGFKINMVEDKFYIPVYYNSYFEIQNKNGWLKDYFSGIRSGLGFKYEVNKNVSLNAEPYINYLLIPDKYYVVGNISFQYGIGIFLNYNYK